MRNIVFSLCGMLAPVTSTGIVHIVLAGLSSLTTILSMMLMGYWFRTIPRLRGYGIYSFISSIVVFISGGVSTFETRAQAEESMLLVLRWGQENALELLIIAAFSSMLCRSSCRGKHQ